MSGHRARARRRQLQRERRARAARGGIVDAYQLASPVLGPFDDYRWSRPPGNPQAARTPAWALRTRYALAVAWPAWEAVLLGLVVVAVGAAGWGLQGALWGAGAVVVLWGAALVAALSCYQKD